MADKKRRNTPNTGNKRNNGRRKKEGQAQGFDCCRTDRSCRSCNDRGA